MCSGGLCANFLKYITHLCFDKINSSGRAAYNTFGTHSLVYSRPRQGNTLWCYNFLSSLFTFFCSLCLTPCAHVCWCALVSKDRVDCLLHKMVQTRADDKYASMSCLKYLRMLKLCLSTFFDTTLARHISSTFFNSSRRRCRRLQTEEEFLLWNERWQRRALVVHRMKSNNNHGSNNVFHRGGLIVKLISTFVSHYFSLFMSACWLISWEELLEGVPAVS